MIDDVNTEKLKPMPCGAFKKQVFRMYPKTPEGELRANILYCQREVYPHRTEQELKHKQWLSKNVLKELIKYEGVPDGYQDNLNK